MTEIRRNPATLARLAAEALTARREAASRDLVARLETVLAALTRGYPAQEIAAWSRKIEAARAVLAFGADPLISIEAEARGVTPAALAYQVVAKGEAFERIVARVSALRASAQVAIEAASTQDALDAILTSAAAQAEAAVAAETPLPPPLE